MGDIVRAAFNKPDSRKQGGNVADLDNGYLRIANDIQDAICCTELNGQESRVLAAIIRLTYGWNRAEDRITNSLIADKTALAVKKVSVAVQTLEYRRIINVRRIGQTRYIGINTKLSGWVKSKPNCSRCVLSFVSGADIPTYQIQVMPSPKTGMVITDNGDAEITSQTIPENDANHPQKRGTPSPEMGNTKDTYLKDTKENTNTSGLQKNGVQDAADEQSDLTDVQKRHPDAAICTPAGKQWGTEADLTTARWVFKKICEIDDTAAPPSWARWANEIRLLRSSRSVTHHDICAVYLWAHKDSFWSTNILSTGALRRQWQKLRMQMTGRAGQQSSNIDFDNTDWAGGAD